MPDVQLSQNTGIEKIDLIMRGLIGIFEMAFPNRIRAYYLGGSYSDGTGVDHAPGERTIHASDIDFFAIFKGKVAEEEGQKFGELVRYLNFISSTGLDLHPESDEEVLREDKFPSVLNVLLKISSKFLYGEDIRDQLPLMPFDSYMFHVLNHAFYHTGIMRQGDKPITFPLQAPLVLPLQYPDPEGEFYGYDLSNFRRANGQLDRPGTRILVASTLWGATVNLVLKTGRYTGTKGQTVQVYRELVNDEWTQLVEDIFYKCKKEWGYLVPSDATGRQELREMCRRALELENFYLGLSKDYLLNVLRKAEDRHKLEALEALQNVIYPGDEVSSAVKDLQESENEEVRQAAAKTLEVISANMPG